MFVDGPEHDVRLDGLGDVVVHACFKALFDVVVKDVGCHGDDRHRGGVGASERADEPGGLKAVRDRHADVHQDAAEVADRGVFKDGRACFAVVGDFDHKALLFQQRAGDLLVERVVLAEQQMEAAEGAVHAAVAGLSQGRFGVLVRRHAVEVEVEAEDGAFAEFAAHGDAAAHEADQLFSDREAEAGAAKLGAVVAVFLREGLEEHALELPAHADAVVRHVHVHGHAEAGQARLFDVVADRAAFGRVFDGVGEQVEDDLVDAQLVEQRNEVRQHRFRLVEELLAALAAERFDDRLYIAAEFRGRIGLGAQLDLAAFGLRHVQHVVNEGEQKARGGADFQKVLPGLRRQLHFRREVGHADDAVQRRSDVVAHLREEFGFGAVGSVGPIGGLLEREARGELLFLLLLDVLERVDQVLRRSVAGFLDGDEEGAAPAEGGGFKLKRQILPSEQPLPDGGEVGEGDVLLPVFRFHKNGRRIGEQPGGGAAVLRKDVEPLR